MPTRPKSRITTACNSCRLRKQKCCGNRPTCIQCLQHRRDCNWPEQQKRGPAKGYIEALEHRLYETENLLMGLLEQVSDSQLASGIPHATAHLQSGKRGSEHWKRFPLRSVHEIRSWQEDFRRSAAEHVSTSTPNFDLAEIPSSNAADVSSIQEGLPQRPQQKVQSLEPQPSVSEWSGAPSSDFQQRFLW
ncbi:Zn(II)2Cys6 transcription factor domain-containing protein [Aspergillus lucknowensis]|uniref:Zn(2)-C6 fungal-type domain-containing protein n=1 Tax=Aspergillus lucknowensis TaxID=176173 RepID=A0ABR4M369_9EURO